MKKVICLILSVVIVLGLSGCGLVILDTKKDAVDKPEKEIEVLEEVEEKEEELQEELEKVEKEVEEKEEELQKNLEEVEKEVEEKEEELQEELEKVEKEVEDKEEETVDEVENQDEIKDEDGVPLYVWDSETESPTTVSTSAEDGVVISYYIHENGGHSRKRTNVKQGDYKGATAAVCKEMGYDYNKIINSVEVIGEELKTITVDFKDYDLEAEENFNLILELNATYIFAMGIENVCYFEDGVPYGKKENGLFYSKNDFVENWPEMTIPTIEE